MVRRKTHRETAKAERSERLPAGGVMSYLRESRGVWFTGWPRVGRWHEILGRFEEVREHADDPMRVVEIEERSGRVCVLRVEIADRTAGRVITLRHAGEPFPVKSFD